MKFFTLAIFVASFVAVFGEQARYDNYRVYSIKVENEEQLNALHDLETIRDGISFLETPHAVDQTAEIVVPPHKLADISDLLESFQMKFHIKTKDMQK